MRVLKDFNKMNSQAEMQCHSIAQCLLNMEECNRMSGSGGCAAACCFLKPATKRQTEGTGECFARLKQHMACRLCLANVAVCLACQMAGRRHAACMAGCLPPAGQPAQAWHLPASRHVLTLQLPKTWVLQAARDTGRAGGWEPCRWTGRTGDWR